MKDVPKTWVLTENQFEDFRLKKNRNNILDLSKKNQWKTKNPEPYRYQSIMALVNSKS